MRLIALLIAFALMPLAAAALSLSEARAQGAVAETPEGYIKAVKRGAEVDELVTAVNIKRRVAYERISKANGQPVEVVGKLAAAEIAKNLDK